MAGALGLACFCSETRGEVWVEQPTGSHPSQEAVQGDESRLWSKLYSPGEVGGYSKVMTAFYLKYSVYFMQAVSPHMYRAFRPWNLSSLHTPPEFVCLRRTAHSSVRWPSQRS